MRSEQQLKPEEAEAVVSTCDTSSYRSINSKTAARHQDSRSSRNSVSSALILGHRQRLHYYVLSWPVLTRSAPQSLLLLSAAKRKIGSSSRIFASLQPCTTQLFVALHTTQPLQPFYETHSHTHTLRRPATHKHTHIHIRPDKAAEQN